MAFLNKEGDDPLSQNISIVKESLSVSLPDKSFFDICHERYGVNKGVYNVIDNWFFLQGYQDIELRRNTILKFLAFLHEINIKKFGKGGVKTNLASFIANQMDKGGD
jgi:riboflavin kinase